MIETPPRHVVMRNFGGLGNRMIRYMVAQRIAHELGGWPVVGYQMPEWGMVSEVEEPLSGHGFATGWEHRLDLPALARRAVAEQADYVEVDAFGQRLEYFAERRAHYAQVFSASPGFPVADNELAINLRTGDIVNGVHRDYTPLPLAFYHSLLEQTGLSPVFVGQTEENWYTCALRAQFPDARYLSGGALADFQTMRGARHVVLAVSTFSWLAAWLSDAAETVHMPLAGLFNPQQRGDIDLVVQGDPRWRFHAFAPGHFRASEEQKAVLTSAAARPLAAAEEWAGGPFYMGYTIDS
ncbi:hypothetical protein [Altererythrobacter lauratis]|uniref:Glycosyl transferase family 11 n=1 Tax=Alteraurantiacibacter lauratis TaxID=2054627 RepID=A0ABV7ECQ1_9SPHN